MFGEFGESFVIAKPKPFNFVPTINNLLADLFIHYTVWYNVPCNAEVINILQYSNNNITPPKHANITSSALF